LFLTSHSQKVSTNINLFPPLSGPLYLSGAFGEVRTDHFHSGVDFRTGGKANAEVFASEKGFISRIKISGGGFGKAIYIDHPNGYTTVYAHLDRFIGRIDKYVKDQQYKQELFEIDIYLKPYVIRVERGELIAMSGNSGSSGGPHLHYEVRRTLNQMPVNPSFTNLAITDNLKPSVRGLWIYTLDSSVSTNIKQKTPIDFKSNNGDDITISDTVKTFGTVGLAIKAYDYVNTGSTRCGINSLVMWVNGVPWYSFKVDGFLFSETRYVNSHIDYEIRQLEGKRIHKLFIDPNNKFSNYGTIRNQGRLTVKPDSIYAVKIEVGDAYGNNTYVNLTLKGIKPKTDFSILNAETSNIEQVYWSFYKKNIFKRDDISIEVPADALYNDLQFTYSVSGRLKGTFSQVYHIHNRLTPVHKAFTLKIVADSLPAKYRQKALLGTFSPKGEIISAGGSYVDGAVTASLRSFGDYFVYVDTIAPTIRSINLANGKDMSKEKSIRFKVDDEFSGIGKIRGTINGKWVLFDYDPKNKLIMYEFDAERLEQKRNQILEITIIDQMGNANSKQYKFLW
jgi:murein DD-endopeptidase MepM/ murein hydrolase activator NlpD